jgi:hypothetical protein
MPVFRRCALLAPLPRTSGRACGAFAAALVVAALTLSCNGSGGSGRGPSGARDITPGPPLTLQEYFQQVDGAFTRLESDLSSDPEPSLPAGGGLSSLVEALRASLDQLETATASFRDDLLALDPPAEASQAHQSFVKAVERDLDSIQKVRENAEQTDDLDAITEALRSAGRSSPESRDRCRDLQAISDENGVEIQLPCEE